MARLRPAALALLGLAACDPLHTGFAPVEPAVRYRSAVPPGPGAAGPAAAAPGRIKVMTWNLKFGAARVRFFFECRGTRTRLTGAEVKANLDAIAARIRAEAPDVVLLQEVDTGKSRRVAYLDEVQYLLDRSGLPFAAYASQWKADWVPSDDIGPVDSGNVVMSRWPILRATRHALPLQTDRWWLERYFYLKRNLLEVHLAVPGVRDLAVVATHAEAFSKDGTKRKHLEALQALMDRLAAGGALVIGGGDLNAIPPGSPACRAFPEDAGCTSTRFPPDDYCGEEPWLAPLQAAYRPDVPPAEFAARPGPWLTFTGDEHFPPNRKIDHLFTSGRWAGARVLQDAVMLSDHVPVVAELELP